MEECAIELLRAKNALKLYISGDTSSDPWQLFESFRRRVHDGLKKPTFFIVAGTAKDLFEPNQPLFGSTVATQFPTVQYEVAEAGKCLALNRNTAAAFYAIRCLELGIRALSRCLEIPDPTKGAERNWSMLLRNLKAKIDAKWPSATDKFSGDGQFFEEAHAALAAIQNPYRNPTMHLDAVYSAAEAQDIINMVGFFMKRIASRMNEDGAPRA